MKNIKEDALTWFQITIFAVLWLCIMVITRTDLSFSVEAFKKLPEVVTAYTVIYYIFKRWLWRWSFLQNWLIPFPDLQGTWEGTIKSTWLNPETGLSPDPIPVILVVRQSFNSISCVMHTKESSSSNSASNIVKEDGSEIVKLSYNYTNTPDAAIRERSAVHKGAALLTYVTKPDRILKGEYWTNRKTTGSLTLSFKSNDLFEAFPTV